MDEALPRLIECELEKVSRSYKARTGGCDGFHSKVLFGLDKRNEERNRGVLGEGAAEWKVAAASLYNDVLSDSEECCK